MPNLARHIPSPAPRSLAAAVAACLAIALSTPAQQNPTTAPAVGQPYTIQTRVPLTIVDVVVTDSKGHPVHGLQQSDFTLLEDNQPVHPNSFEEHRSDEASPATGLTTLNLPPNAFTNATPTPPSNRPLNILLIDNLNTPTQVQQRVKLEMLDYIKRMPPGTPMAVFGLNTRLFIVQGITTDPELLKAAVSSDKNYLPAPPMQDFDQDPAMIDARAPPMPGDPNPRDEVDIARTSERAEYTLNAMRQLARYLSGMAGRKNLIWFGGSFPTAWPPEYMPGAGSCYDYRDALNAATDLLARAHVAINPIESRGLRIDNNSNRKLLEEHHNMDLRADQTGGHAVYTSNDLAGAVADDIDFGSNFYTLTYTPTNQNLDTRFRTIKVTVSQPNLHLTYRNGYYAVAPETDARGKKIDAATPMQAALMRGALPATQILFRVNVAQSPTPEATAPSSNQPDAKLMHPPYRHYDIAYVIDVHGIQFAPSPDGNYRGDFEYGVRVYNADGDEVVNSTAKTVSPILPPAVYKSMQNGGANAHQEIDVPATGDYFLRIAVHDLATGSVGSIEIPTASITP